MDRTQFEQILRVNSDEIDGDESGAHWRVDYVLIRTHDDAGLECYDVYTDDGYGNGDMICRGYNKHVMRSLTLKLGQFAGALL